MLGACAGPPPRVNPAAIGHEAAQEAGVFVVEYFDVIGAHDADTPPPKTSTLGPVIVAYRAAIRRPRAHWRPPRPIAVRRGTRVSRDFVDVVLWCSYHRLFKGNVTRIEICPGAAIIRR